LVKLQTCSKCQLQYFSPAIPGSAQFYSELTSSCPHYYTDHKWEFDYVKNFLKHDDKVLDVACGKGAFLRSIIDSVGVAIGIDTNPDAVSSNGDEAKLRIHNQSVEEFSVEHGEQFDLVSAFQVIEHLGSVMPFVWAAYRCVKPGGILALSVPNRARRRDLSFGSLDYPPHHISRWAKDQLSMIAMQLNAELVSIAKEPLDKSQTIGALRLKELPELLPFEFASRDFIIKVLSRLALTFPFSLVWKNLRMAERLSMYGMSMIAIIRKPTAERPSLTKSSWPMADAENGYKE
jgi:2-polyprenyl-3-methyl-5-hydroxy-6-metoxy-1,4-benzoquinol methylase